MRKQEILKCLNLLNQHIDQIQNVTNIEIIRGANWYNLDKLDEMMARNKELKSRIQSLIYN